MSWLEAKLQLKEKITADMDLTESLTNERLAERIEQEVFAFSRQQYMTAAEKQALVMQLFHAFRGLDVLQPLVDDRSITEIMVNRHDCIFIEKDGKLLQTDLRFDTKERLEDVIQTIVGKVNRIVNESSPIVDARLADGSRVNIVLPPASLDGPALTIRKFPETPFTLEDLIRIGAVSTQAAAWLTTMVKAKYNIFISGGTGSGKTTFLNALAQHIPNDERIVTIEDAAELQIRGIPNLVRLEARNANAEGKGQITIRDLIRTSLRMRPSRIIIGEVRGSEALDMLQALNTGHDGGLSTGHANSAKDMISRLESMVLSGAELPIPVVRKQIASAIDIIVHLQRMRDRSRKVTEISEVVGIVDGEAALRPLFLFREQPSSGKDCVVGELVPAEDSLLYTDKLQLAGVSLPVFAEEETMR